MRKWQSGCDEGLAQACLPPFAPSHFRTFLFLALSIGGLTLCGCTGRAEVQMVPVNRADLPPRESLIQRIIADEAYYTVSDDGALNIALRRDWRPPLFPRLASEWAMSLVLDGLPAGSERLYPLSTREVRAVHSGGGSHRRWRALMGVAVIQAPRNGRLKGRFHATVQQQQYGLLTGWTPPVYRGPILVLVGEFEALENASRVEEIVTRTEADDFERPVTTDTTRPEPLEFRALPGPAPAPAATRPAED